MPTAFEIAQTRQVPLSMGIFGAVLTDAPAISRFDARPIVGTKYRTLATVSLPDASVFAAYGQGFALSYGHLGFREASCQLFGGMIGADTISSRAWDQENAASGYSYFDLQAMLKFQQDMLNMERQLFYGLARDANGFPGLKDVTPFASGNVLITSDSPDESDYVKTVINATGTTSSTASSIYGVRFGELDAQLIIGNVAGEGEMINMGDIVRQMQAPDSTKPTELLEYELQQFHGYIGLAVAGHTPQTAGQAVPVQYCVRRVANVTKDSGKTNNDALMNALVQSFPDNKLPSILFMSKRSGQQLANSKASTSVTFLAGASSAQNGSVTLNPPPPDNWEGIPICYTRAIRNDDAIES